MQFILKAKLVVPVDFLPSALAVVKKQDGFFQDWEVSRIPKLYSVLVARKYMYTEQNLPDTMGVVT